MKCLLGWIEILADADCGKSRKTKSESQRTEDRSAARKPGVADAGRPPSGLIARLRKIY